MLDVKVVRRAAISDGTHGSRRGIDVIVIIAWQWYRSIIDCRFASLPLLRVTLSSLIVVLGVLRLTRCSRCSYIHFFSLTMTVPRYIFFNVVRIALSPSFLFLYSLRQRISDVRRLIRCFAVALDVSGCSRCCAVDRCWLLLRYETVIRALRDFARSSEYQKSDTNPFCDRQHRHLRNWKYHYRTSFYRTSKINLILSKKELTKLI